MQAMSFEEIGVAEGISAIEAAHVYQRAMHKLKNHVPQYLREQGRRRLRELESTAFEYDAPHLPV